MFPTPLLASPVACGCSGLLNMGEQPIIFSKCCVNLLTKFDAKSVDTEPYATTHQPSKPYFRYNYSQQHIDSDKRIIVLFSERRNLQLNPVGFDCISAWRLQSHLAQCFTNGLSHCIAFSSVLAGMRHMKQLLPLGTAAPVAPGVPRRQPHRRSGLATCPLWELSPSHPVLV